MELNPHIRRMLAPIQRRVFLMIRRAIVRVVNDGAGIQLVQLDALAGETIAAAEHFQSYGLTAHPHAGAEAVLLGAGGMRSHSIAIMVDDRRYRLRGLRAGEVALYDDQGQTIVLRRDRIEVTAPQVVVLSPDVRLGGADGPQVARVGDTVVCPAGTGQITSGSSHVRAA